jgi:hypothetical protein
MLLPPVGKAADQHGGRQHPPMLTVPTTGEGARPPPVNLPERSPPQSPPEPITPEPLIRFTA